MEEIPPPFPSEEVLFVMVVYAIVVFPFKLTIPIAPPFDLQWLFEKYEDEIMPFEFKIARAPPRQSSDKQLLFFI